MGFNQRYLGTRTPPEVKGLMRRTMAVRRCVINLCTFLNRSLQQREMTKFCAFWRFIEGGGGYTQETFRDKFYSLKDDIA